MQAAAHMLLNNYEADGIPSGNCKDKKFQMKEFEILRV